ncbi:hypothetical protein EW026_g2734 [Hermanssonia centrifuga]|uniref:Uncharacterized protein n=1 Tax=Hermanssonia centrifuga TaxID=98765 RepID=A0A4S4KM96_9APHY|nr:hypothetical protein EW026_g2734 [Hermanssonia centrifuga]
MSRVVYHSRPALKVTSAMSRKWAPSAAVWGAGAGVMVLYILSVTPLVKRGFLTKLPVVGAYWEDKTPASDKPF